ncbi:hypothetical protein [Azospirillum agricola]|uniref:hypothetical protein n=1 Tax=Azospirillum agricola TaxID=1720247 RepID=UPI000A0EF003|nr:hypothetical protein [Azospirillum agricola]SMH63005.1 hypothetical protein SAMN02982994_6832 [Azospirillum lipoferum]
MSAPPKRFAPPPPSWPGCASPRQPGPAIQRQVAQPQTTFNALRSGKAERGKVGDELVRMQGDQFLLSTAERNLRVKPDGTYNFVRVQGNTRNEARTFVSANSGHAGLAAGRPVLYAGTVRFDSGSLDWWSNYSGTYQPMAAFRQQAHLPDERFVPWQKLQMGGVGLQRGMLSDQRASTVPAKPEGATTPKPAPRLPDPAKAASVGTGPAGTPTPQPQGKGTEKAAARAAPAPAGKGR